MRSLAQRSVPGIFLTVIAFAVAAVVSTGTNVNLAWHEVTLIALGIGVIVCLALAMPPGTFRPIASPGFDIVDLCGKHQQGNEDLAQHRYCANGSQLRNIDN